MKIVHIEDFFHPDAGYQLNILAKYMVQMGHSVTILTAETKKVPDNLKVFFDCENIGVRDKCYTDKYGVKIVRVALKTFVSGRAVFDRAIFRRISEEGADVIFVHGNNTLIAMQCLLRRKKIGVPLVMDCHMLEMASKNKFKILFETVYKAFFAPIIRREGIPVIRIQEDAYVQKCLGIPLSQCPWISVGSDTMLFHPDDVARRRFREAHEISENAFVVLYAGKLDESKGGMLLAEALKDKFCGDRELVAVIVGKSVGEYGDNVETMLGESGNRIIRLPTQRYEDLAYIYSACDLAVFPKQCSLSFYDVEACGLPVVFEDNQINSARAAHGNAVVFKQGDVQDFREKIMSLYNLPPADFLAMKRRCVDFVRANYDYSDIAKQYMKVIEKAVSCYKR